MSPIIYTPHDCEPPPGEDLRNGTLWQCDVCEAVWEAARPRVVEWNKIAQPRREKIVADPLKRPALTSETTIPTVTTDMVQLALDAYTDHSSPVQVGHLGTTLVCRKCETSMLGHRAALRHAREKAAEALQDALRGETHE